MTSVLGGRRESLAASPSVVQELLADSVAGLRAGRSAGAGKSVSLPRAQPVGGVPKRCMDIIVSLAMLIVLAPFMLVIAAIIRVSLGGPVIFAQPRIGYRGRGFTCYKFRSMPTNADEVLRQHLVSDPAAAKEWQETRKLLNDPRVGCLGRVLRKSSIDELPQLFNVLLGEMSLVGPRPVVPEELANYGRYARIYGDSRPGITGLWQTSGRNRLSYRARIARDSYYARHWSLWLDVILLLKTIPAIMSFDDTA